MKIVSIKLDKSSHNQLQREVKDKAEIYEAEKFLYCQDYWKNTIIEKIGYNNLIW